MEGDAHLSDADGSTIGFGLDRDLVTDAGAQQGRARKRGQVGSRSGAGVVAVSVSDERAIDGEHRVDMEISGGAVQAGCLSLKERHMLIVVRRWRPTWPHQRNSWTERRNIQLPKQYKALLVRRYKRWSTGAGVANTSSSMSFTARISQSGPALITATWPLSLAA